MSPLDCRMPGDITVLLNRMSTGDQDAQAELMELVYPELSRLARRQRRRSDPMATRTTGLVNEAYLRLVGRGADYADREHFLAVAATAMRHVLVDHARSRQRLKRGGDRRSTTLGDGPAVMNDLDLVLAIHEALDGLGAIDPRLVQVVECLYFAGLTGEETADALGVSLRTVRRMWRAAQTWLRRELDDSVT